MDFYRRLQALGDGPVNADEEHPPQAGVFAKGRVAQLVAVPGLVQAIERTNPDLKDKLGFFPVPGKTAAAPGAVFTGGSDLVVPKNTDDRPGATAVISALMRRQVADRTGPDDELRAQQDDPRRSGGGRGRCAAMAAGAAQGRATPASPEWAAVEADNPIKDYMTKVLTGSDPATEARRAARRITETLAGDTG